MQPTIAEPVATARIKIRALPDPSEDQAALGGRSADARMARVHLRGGLLALSRATLERMAGAGTLDVDAMADLAEVRWRSGDTQGAAEAAQAHQASGGGDPMAVLILAEELARIGQGADAQRLAASVQTRTGGAVDILFAGQPRSAAWPPADPAWMDADANAPGRWGLLVGGSEVAMPTPDTWTDVPVEQPEEGPAQTPAATALPLGRGEIGRPGGQTSTSAIVMSGRLAGEELDRVDASLASGQIGSAAERLGVLLRLDPALAPVILSAADRAIAGTPQGSPGLAAIQLVRGDAYRVLGRDTEAAAAYQLAHQTLAPGSPPEEPT